MIIRKFSQIFMLFLAGVMLAGCSKGGSCVDTGGMDELDASKAIARKLSDLSKSVKDEASYRSAIPTMKACYGDLKGELVDLKARVEKMAASKKGQSEMSPQDMEEAMKIFGGMMEFVGIMAELEQETNRIHSAIPNYEAIETETGLKASMEEVEKALN